MSSKNPCERHGDASLYERSINITNVQVSLDDLSLEQLQVVLVRVQSSLIKRLIKAHKNGNYMDLCQALTYHDSDLLQKVFASIPNSYFESIERGDYENLNG